MADTQTSDPVHEARVARDAQDRAAIEVAEGVTVPQVATERGLFVAMSERSKPFLAKYGHEHLGDFLAAVGSDAQLAKRVITELIEERFASEPTAPPEAEPDPRIAELEGELEAAREVLGVYDAKVDGIAVELAAALKQAAELRAELDSTHDALTDAFKEIAELKAELAAAEASAAAAIDTQIHAGDDKQEGESIETEPPAAETEVPVVETAEGEHAA